MGQISANHVKIMSALQPFAYVRLSKAMKVTSIPYLDENSIFNPILCFFSFSIKIYYFKIFKQAKYLFSHIAASITVIYNVTNYFVHRIFNTNRSLSLHSNLMKKCIDWVLQPTIYCYVDSGFLDHNVYRIYCLYYVSCVYKKINQSIKLETPVGLTYSILTLTALLYRVAQKSKPLPNDQKSY